MKKNNQTFKALLIIILAIIGAIAMNSCNVTKYFITNQKGVVIHTKISCRKCIPQNITYVEFNNGEILGIYTDSTYQVGDTITIK